MKSMINDNNPKWVNFILGCLSIALMVYLIVGAWFANEPPCFLNK